jgi:hypothetical protein
MYELAAPVEERNIDSIKMSFCDFLSSTQFPVSFSK